MPLTIFKMNTSSNLESCLIRSLIFIESSLKFPSNRLQDVLLLKFRKLPDSFSYIY